MTKGGKEGKGREYTGAVVECQNKTKRKKEIKKNGVMRHRVGSAEKNKQG